MVRRFLPEDPEGVRLEVCSGGREAFIEHSDRRMSDPCPVPFQPSGLSVLRRPSRLFSRTEQGKQTTANGGSEADREVPHRVVAIATGDRICQFFDRCLRGIVRRHEKEDADRTYGDTDNSVHCHGTLSPVSG